MQVMTEDGRIARLRTNLEGIRQRISEACRRASRAPSEVRVVAVTKYVDAATAAHLHAAGCHDLGESRPQALQVKAAALADLHPLPRWHLIGHLQRNKVRRTMPLVALMHSLDSRRLLEALEAAGREAGRRWAALVEVNLADDPARTGARPDEAAALMAAAQGLAHVEIRGLMGMARLPDGQPAAARADFAALRELRDRLRVDLPPGSLPELSMGMSGDFEEAILEGSTLVRIGSALFEGLEA
jgi:pyridoxal phosphate enzyme (YggS family)